MGGSVQAADGQGTMSGTLKRMGTSFELSGQATVNGVPSTSASVSVTGAINGTIVEIDYTAHTP